MNETSPTTTRPTDVLDPDVVRNLLEQEDRRELLHHFEPLHPAEIAELATLLDVEEILAVLALFPATLAGNVLDELNEELRGRVIELVDDAFLVAILGTIAVDKATDLLDLMPSPRRTRLINSLDLSRSAELRKLQRYDSETAGGLMSSQFITVTPELTIAQVEQLVRSRRLPYSYALCVVDDHHHFLGSLKVKDVLLSARSSRVSAVMNRDTLSVQPGADQEEVANLFRKYDLFTLPVIDAGRSLLGLITVDDILEVVHDEGTEDLFKLAGTSETAPLSETILSKVFKRLPWLLITLCGGILCSVVMQRFEHLLSAQVAVAFFIPLIMMISGNISIQSSTIMVRSIATGDLGIEHQILKSILREILVGTLLGLACGTLVSLLVALLTGKLVLGGIVFLSMILSISIASAMGVLIPISVNRFGIDPALVSGPFVTSLNDVSATTIYLVMLTILS